MHSGLARRVCSANYENLFILAGEGLRHGCSIVDAGALEPFDTWSSERSPLDASCNQQCMTRDVGAIGELHDTLQPVDSKAERFLRRQNLNTQTPRLSHRPVSEIGSA